MFRQYVDWHTARTRYVYTFLSIYFRMLFLVQISFFFYLYYYYARRRDSQRTNWNAAFLGSNVLISCLMPSLCVLFSVSCCVTASALKPSLYQMFMNLKFNLRLATGIFRWATDFVGMRLVHCPVDWSIWWIHSTAQVSWEQLQWPMRSSKIEKC